MAVKRSLNLSAAASLLDPPKYIKAPEKTKVERAPRVKLNKKLIPLTIYKVVFPWTNNTLGTFWNLLSLHLLHFPQSASHGP
jgi:hypothetical protein